MLTRIAARNVKRQLSSYLIYFITIVLTVALIFAVNNVIYSKEILFKSGNIKELKSGITALTVLICVIVMFVLGYATSFMIRLRKREFGMYLTLGMTKKNILTIFFIETLIMVAAAIMVGTLLGLVLYQGLMALLCVLLEMPTVFAAYSIKGLILTVATVIVMFFLSSLAAALYLNKVSIIALIHGDKTANKDVKHPFIWLVTAILSLVCLIICIVAVFLSIKKITTGEDSGMLLFALIALIAVLVILLHISASKSIIALMLKNKRFAANGTNTFMLRQIGGKLKANSIMMGLLAFLITFAIIGANISFTQKAIAEENLNFSCPFDINASIEKDEVQKFTFDEAEAIINQYTKIESKQCYSIYEGGDNYLHSFTRYSGENYALLKDSFVSLSDFNAMLKLIGKSEIMLRDEFAIIENISKLDADFSSANLKLDNKSYKFKSIISGGRYFSHGYFVVVVPDQAVSKLDKSESCVAYKLASNNFDAQALVNALSYTVDIGQYDTLRCDYQIKESHKNYIYEQAAIFILGTLYIAIVFVFMAMALLALKTLSEIGEDKLKYAVLSRLGASNHSLRKTLFGQIFSFFITPFLIPLLFSIPAGTLCYQIMASMGFMSGISGIVVITVSIAAIMIAIYLLYFTATYFIAKKNILSDL